MKKHKLIVILGLFVLLAFLIAGCGNGGGMDTSSAAPITDPSVSGGSGAGAPPLDGASGAPSPAPTAPSASPAMPGMPGAESQPNGQPQADKAAAATKNQKVVLSAALPAGTKVKIYPEKQWDGTVLNYLCFRYKSVPTGAIDVQLPAQFKDEMMTRSEWADMFVSYATPVEVINSDKEAAAIHSQLGVIPRPPKPTF